MPSFMPTQHSSLGFPSDKQTLKLIELDPNTEYTVTRCKQIMTTYGERCVLSVENPEKKQQCDCWGNGFLTKCAGYHSQKPGWKFNTGEPTSFTSKNGNEQTYMPIII